MSPNRPNPIPTFSMERSQIHRVSVADQVASVLRQKILNGVRVLSSAVKVTLGPKGRNVVNLEPGFGGMTIREATRILSLENLLKRSVHRGVAVSQLSLKDVQEIYHLRRMLEISGVLAAKDNRREVLPELGSAVEGYELAVRERDWLRAVSWQSAARVILSAGHRRIANGDGAGRPQSRRSQRPDSGAPQDVSVIGGGQAQAMRCDISAASRRF